MILSPGRLESCSMCSIPHDARHFFFTSATINFEGSCYSHSHSTYYPHAITYLFRCIDPYGDFAYSKNCRRVIPSSRIRNFSALSQTPRWRRVAHRRTDYSVLVLSLIIGTNRKVSRHHELEVVQLGFLSPGTRPMRRQLEPANTAKPFPYLSVAGLLPHQPIPFRGGPLRL